MKHIAFTGTQIGMTAKQYATVLTILDSRNKNRSDICGHGDCIGADAEFHYIAWGLGFPVVGFPPSNNKKRAYCNVGYAHDPLPYLKRNHKMVDWCDVLIATPRQIKEQLRSGTWATIRYAKKKRKTVHIVFPDGSVLTETYVTPLKAAEHITLNFEVTR